jgi:Flp pilus assembly protein TadD
VADAVVYFAAAAKLKPDDAEIHNNLGAALVRTGRVGEGIAEFEHALRLKPDYAEARTNLEVTKRSR